MNRAALRAAAFGLTAGLVGCGGSAARAPQTPPAEPLDAVQGGSAVPGQAEVDSGRERQAPPSESSESGATVGTLLAEVLAAEADMLSAGSTCGTACRALRSMERAAKRLCAIASDDAEMETCEQARVRVEEARRRVEATCGRCAEDIVR